MARISQKETKNRPSKKNVSLKNSRDRQNIFFASLVRSVYCGTFHGRRHTRFLASVLYQPVNTRSNFKQKHMVFFNQKQTQM